MNNITYKSAYKGTLALLVIAGVTTSGQSVFAQLIPDNTLATESSNISSNGLKDTVTGGATRGTNLFHSFTEFNVDIGKSVYFANPVNIENILTRVTGGNVSNIFGKLGVEGNANLFLINPNGIYFGNGASLDIKGSFTATTADSIKLGENGFGLFSTSDPQSSNFLSVQPGSLFVNALANQQAEIKNEGNLKVADGKNITLFGANVTNTGTLTAQGGTVQITGAENLKVRGNIKTDTLLLDTKNLTIGEDDSATIDKATLESLSGNTNLIFQAINNFNINPLSDKILSLASGNGSIKFTTDADNNGVGNFQMDITDNIKTNGRDISILGANLTLGNIDSTLESVGGNINLQYFNNSGKITLIAKQGSIDAGSIYSFGNYGGNITLEAKNNIYRYRGNILARGTMKSGDVTLKASSVDLTGTVIYTTNYTMGDAGNISIYGDYVQLDQGALGSDLFNHSGNTNQNRKAGIITINATKDIYLKNNSFINSYVRSRDDRGTSYPIYGDWQGGIINIQANSLYINDSSINTAVRDQQGKGIAGNININVNENLNISRSIIVSDLEENTQGKGGNIKVNANNFTLENGSQIRTPTAGLGNAGDITINANNVKISGITENKLCFDSCYSSVPAGSSSGLFSNTTPSSEGKAGNILINTDILTISDGAIISASNVNGAAGNINITANKLTANNGGQILTSTSGNAKAGNIIMKVRDNITLDGTNTGLFANTQIGSTGDSGSIDIDPEIFIIRNGAGIGVNSQGNGKGGNITLQAGTLILDNQAFITAETINNEGGEITLNINDLFWLRNNSNITATAGTAGAGGNG
ncbi:filamentous hemagglutinin N-terminal domain-containing protein, partial [Anabaena sp. FACHB-1237]|uniref:two-partner secretion domain-containing protein n=1 Tax=Anabaena sp. FACHB-1237 TaxID=2692769 RepID=UPI001681AF0E